MSHAEKAREYFKQGYNCSQAVVLAFCDVTGLDEKTALALSSSFGGGMGRLREVCGAVSGMFLVAGCLWGPTDPADRAGKAAHYALIQEMARRFRERSGGSIVCRELLGLAGHDRAPTPTERTPEFYQKRPCVQLVSDAAEIMDEILAEKAKA